MLAMPGVPPAVEPCAGCLNACPKSLRPPSASRLASRRIPPSQLVLPEVTPATRLLEKRRQQFEADEALEAAKQQYATQARH